MPYVNDIEPGLELCKRSCNALLFAWPALCDVEAVKTAIRAIAICVYMALVSLCLPPQPIPSVGILPRNGQKVKINLYLFSYGLHN